MAIKTKAAGLRTRAASKYHTRTDFSIEAPTAVNPTCSSLDVLLSRLDAVRETCPSRWIARCPAHSDRHPSLSIREADDGTVLVHCFAGCSVEGIVAAVGLELSDLFPGSIGQCHHHHGDHRRERDRQSFSAVDVVRCLRHELAIVVVVASDLRAGKTVGDADYGRFLTAVERITNGLEYTNV